MARRRRTTRDQRNKEKTRWQVIYGNRPIKITVEEVAGNSPVVVTVRGEEVTLSPSTWAVVVTIKGRGDSPSADEVETIEFASKARADEVAQFMTAWLMKLGGNIKLTKQRHETGPRPTLPGKPPRPVPGDSPHHGGE